ncbi:hypothetical protein [Ferruginibacter sp.]
MKTNNGFEINFVYLAYIPPFHDEDQPYILETELIKTESKTTEYLFKIFDSAIDVAKIEILFNSDDKQNNDTRNTILSISQLSTAKAKTTHAQKLAQKLYEITDERNGTGLFTILEGKKEQTTRIVLTRFKGVEGLVNHGKKLLIDYISEVFTKKSNHYKMAVYEDILSTKSFWKGYSIDKQISGSSYKPISFFWIESFLDSKTALTAAQGTLQFSKVIKAILLKTTDIAEQEEIISGVINLRSKKNIQMSVSDFCSTYLSESITAKIKNETNDDFFNSIFLVDNEVYKKEFGKTVLSLQDGITAYVPTFNYEKHVTETLNKDGSKNITIEGKLNSKKINVQQTEKTAK